MTGYKDPPKHSQFRPGVSGNPKGRPKGRNIFADLQEELQQAIADQGTGTQTTKQRLLVKKLVEDAIAGDARAISTVLSMCPRRSDDDLPETDDEGHREILDVFSNRGLRNDETPTANSKARKE